MSRVVLVSLVPLLLLASSAAADDFVLPDPSSPVYYSFAAVAGESVHLSSSRVEGDVHANADLKFGAADVIEGNVSVVGRIIGEGTVTGTSTEGAAAVSLPGLPTAAELRELASQVFEGDTVFAEDLVLDGVVFVNGTAHVLGSLGGSGTLIAAADVLFESPPPAAAASAAGRISVLALGSIDVGKERTLQAVLRAGGNVTLKKRVSFAGAIVADGRVSLHSDAVAGFVSIDQVPPEIRFTAPGEGAVVATESPLLEVELEDDLSGVDPTSLAVTLDGVDVSAEVELTTAGFRLATLALTDGPHALEVSVSDIAGNPAAAPFGFATDTQPPVLAITSPADTTVFEPTVTFAVEYADAVAGIDPASLVVTLDGVDLSAGCAVGPSSATCPPTPVAQGQHTVQAAIDDLVGNRAQASFGFQVVLAAPEPPQVAPPDSPTLARRVTLTGTTESGAGIEVLGGAAPAAGTAGTAGTFALEVDLRPNALNRLFVTAVRDTGERSAPAVAEIIQDEEPPFLAVDLPTEGASTTADVVTVAGRVGDRLSGFLGLGVTVNGEPAEVNVGIGTNGTFDRAAVALALGENTLEVSAADALGNTASVSLVVDRVEPTGPRLVKLSGDDQRGLVGAPLDLPARVRVEDGQGSPLAGKVVSFQVSRSDGSIRPEGASGGGALRQDVLTDSAGEAGVGWTLGSDAGCGNHRLKVTSVGVADQILFSASADPGPAARITVGSGDRQSAETGSPLAESLRVWVSDGRNGIAGVPVTFRVLVGGGEVGGDDTVVVATGLSGHAEADLRLGPSAGANLVEATFAGNPALPVVFTATGLVRGPGTPTALAGTVLDNARRPIGGAVCRLEVGGVEVAQATTDASGTFLLPDVPSGAAHLTVDGSTATTVDGTPVPAGSFPALGMDLVLVPGVGNEGGPILLPPLDTANQRSYDGTQDVVLSVGEIEDLRFTVKAGSMRLADGTVPSPAAPVTLSLDPVHVDDVPMPFPDGIAPPFAWTLQPANAIFDPPVEIEMPNMAALAPGSIVYFLSFDHDTARFEIVATGSVTPDGARAVTDPGSGLTKAGWGGFCPPYPDWGNVEHDPIEDAKEKLRQDAASRAGTASAALAEQLKCLAERACGTGGPDGRPDWAKGFAAEVLQEIANNRASGPSPADQICQSIPATVQERMEDLTFRDLFNIGLSDVCALAGGFYHFRDELAPGFARHMAAQVREGMAQGLSESEAKDQVRQQHDEFINEIPSCFDEVFDLSPIPREMAKADVPTWANRLREGILFLMCQQVGGSSAQAPATAAARATATEDRTFFSPELDGIGNLLVRAPQDRFLLPVGGQFQLTVTDATGNDLSTAASGTEYYLGVADGRVTLGPDGLLSVLGTPEPVATMTPVFYVWVFNGEAFGIGQFAIQPSDQDGDLIADSVELAVGLDPTFNNTASDLDGDGVTDGLEVAAGLDPLDPDTDGDGLSDGEELDQKSDPTDPLSTTAALPTGSTVRVGTQNGTVLGDGAFRISNAAAPGRLVRVIGQGRRGAQTFFGQSTFFDIPELTTLRLPQPIAAFPFPPPRLAGLSAVLETPTLTAVGATSQMLVIGTFADSTVADVTARAQGSEYRTANPAVATVDESGLITAVGAGETFVTALNDGVIAVRRLTVSLGDPLTTVVGFTFGADGLPIAGAEVELLPPLGATTATDASGRFELRDVAALGGAISIGAFARTAEGFQLAIASDLQPVPGGLTDAGVLTLARIVRQDTDGDGVADDVELLLGTDPANPDSDGDGIVDGLEDRDGDGLPDFGEFLVGSNPDLADTDGDGISDAAEDTDGDGFNDGLEATSGCNPTFREATNVTGRVLDALGGPVAQARVGLVDRSDVSGLTDAAGLFGLDDVAACPLEIRVEADGLVAGREARGVSAAVPLVIDGVTDVGDVTLVPVETAVALYPAPKLPVGELPVDIAAVDLDGDGVLDLVTANGRDDDLSVLLGNGDGTFRTQRRFAAGDGPEGIAAGDLNGDGLPELVVTNILGDDVSVLISEGAGSFLPEVRLPAGDAPDDLLLADLDEDGALDLVVANRGTDDLTIYPGNGDGSFAPAGTLAVGNLPTAVIATDWNGDGDLDLATANVLDNDVSILLGDGTGTFVESGRVPLGTRPLDAAAADLDGDGIQDLLTLQGNPLQVGLFLGVGDGTFGAPFVSPVGDSPRWIGAGDIDADGLLDVVAVNGFTNDISLLRGNGDGTVEPEERFLAGFDPNAAAIADLDLDGLLDIAVVNDAGDDITLLLNDGGTLDAPLFREVPNFAGPIAVAVGDLDGDLAQDVVSANTFTDDLVLLFGDGTGNLNLGPSLPAGNSPEDVELADLDGDGSLDIAVANRFSNNVVLYLNDGGGGFVAGTPIAVTRPGSVVAGDATGDGVPDLVVTSTDSDELAVVPGNGDGTFQADFRVPAGPDPNEAILADVNADGAADLVSTADSDEVLIHLGNGDGTFQAAARLAVGRRPGQIVAADLNGDGDLDLAVVNTFASSVSVLLGIGDGTFEAERRFAVTRAPLSLQVADLDGDGNQDLVTASFDFFDAFVLLGDGTGNFDRGRGYTVGNFPEDMAIGDLDGDGRIDIVTPALFPSGVTVLLHK